MGDDVDYPVSNDLKINIETIDRSSVRELVERYTAAAQAARERGENIHQWSLDQQDRVNAFAATLPIEEATLFYNLYSEEMRASASAILDKTREMNIQTAHAQIQTAKSAGNVATWISIIVFFIVLISFIRLIK